MTTKIGQTLNAKDFSSTYKVGQTVGADQFNKNYSQNDVSNHPMNPLNPNNQIAQLKASQPTQSLAKNFFDNIHRNLTKTGLSSFVNPIQQVKDVYGATKSGIGQIKEGIQQVSQQKNPLGGLEGALKVGAGITNTAFSPLAPVFKPIEKGVDYLGDKIGNNPSVQKFANSKAGEVTSRVAEDVGNAATTATGIIGATEVAPEIKKGASDYIAKYKEGQAAKTNATMDKITGQITQGKTTDIPKAKSALSQIDPEGIKTYADLKEALSTKIEAISGKQDEVLGTHTNSKSLDELNVKYKVGEKSVEHNFVKDAAQQLKDFYQKTNQPDRVAMIDQYVSKAQKEGLSIKEVNDLARLHGQELNGFNANGELASGLTKQAAENTRKGVKSTARQVFNNKIYEASDSALTDLMQTRDMVDNMTEQVNKLQQKIQARGLGEKIGRQVGRALNILGLNSPKGFIEYFLGRGTGLKTLNALDLQKALTKNLSKLQDLTSGSDSDIIAKMNAYLKNR